MMTRVLVARGYTVLAAADGAAALALAERHAGRIDLLVTDVVMPGMSGQALAERLARVGGEADRPVLFTTGHAMDAVTNHGVLRPGARLLKKPFAPDVLALAVSEALSGRRTPPGAAG